MEEYLGDGLKIMAPFIFKILYDFFTNRHSVHGKSIKKYYKLKFIDRAMLFTIFIVFAFISFLGISNYDIDIEKTFSLLYGAGLTSYLYLFIGIQLRIFLEGKSTKSKIYRMILYPQKYLITVESSMTIFNIIIAISFSSALISLLSTLVSTESSSDVYVIRTASFFVSIFGAYILQNLIFVVIMDFMSKPEKIFVYIENVDAPIVCEDVFINRQYYVLYQHTNSNENQHEYLLVTKNKVVSIGYTLMQIY